MQKFFEKYGIKPKYGYINRSELVDKKLDPYMKEFYPEITAEKREKLEEVILKRDKNVNEAYFIDSIEFWFNYVFDYWCYEANCVAGYKFRVYSEEETRLGAFCKLLVKLYDHFNEATRLKIKNIVEE